MSSQETQDKVGQVAALLGLDTVGAERLMKAVSLSNRAKERAETLHPRIEGNMLHITVELGPGVPSQSGRTLLLYSSGGFVPVGDGIQVSLLVNRKR